VGVNEGEAASSQAAPETAPSGGASAGAAAGRPNAGAGAVALGIPRIGAPASARSFGTGFDLAPKPMKVVLNWGRKYSLWVFNFGLACCAIEFIAASMARHDFIRLGVIPFAPGPRQADLMVVSGTVSDKMAPAVKRLYEQMPEPKYVISFGACANCGGPYWDSYSVTKGIDQVIPVDVYVPGCPPRPEALLQGIIKLQEKIAAEGTGTAPGRSASVPKALKTRRPKAIRAPEPAAAPPPPPLPPAPVPAVGAPPLEARPDELNVIPAASLQTTELPTTELPVLEPPARRSAPLSVPVPMPPASAPVRPAPVQIPVEASSLTDTTTGGLPVVDLPLGESAAKVRVKVPRRHYFRELRRARDHGLSLFDKAAQDQEWEYDDES
jgi:NADH-quinone oxidoreductase subunit B